jgi:hypothetical protein
MKQEAHLSEIYRLVEQKLKYPDLTSKTKKVSMMSVPIHTIQLWQERPMLEWMPFPRPLSDLSVTHGDMVIEHHLAALIEKTHRKWFFKKVVEKIPQFESTIVRLTLTPKEDLWRKWNYELDITNPQHPHLTVYELHKDDDEYNLTDAPAFCRRALPSDIQAFENFLFDSYKKRQ